MGVERIVADLDFTYHLVVIAIRFFEHKRASINYHIVVVDGHTFSEPSASALTTRTIHLATYSFRLRSDL
jgi:hypothetical protein